MALLTYGRLTDDEILKLSENRVITTYQDFNLRRDSSIEKNRRSPYVGGVYDPEYFGSVYADSCNCGRTHAIGKLCPTCGSMVLTDEEKYRRYARIDVGYYYVLDTKIGALVGLLNDESLPLDISDPQKFFQFTRIGINSAPLICELCQFDWNEELGEIKVSHKITNIAHASYEGLELILKDHFPEKLSFFRTIVNKYYLVAPAAYRMAIFNPYDNTKVKIPLMSSIYQAIVRMKYEIRDRILSLTDLSEKVALIACLRRYCGKSCYWMSQILRTSKETITRQVLASRIDYSGRAPIIDDPDLEIDEVKIPIHLAYDMLKIDFIAYLSEKMGMSPDKAELRYREVSDATLKIFEDYCRTRRVIMNRPPSLHRYNNMSYRLGVTKDQAIHFPITAVVPFGADFDGDAMSFFLVPEQFNELCDKNASPKTQLKYESTGGFIWKPNQDMLYGLILATRVIWNDEKDRNLKEYVSLKDADKDYEDGVIEYPTDHIIMNDRFTSYSREKVSEIIHRPLDDLYESGYVNASNIDILLAYLYQLPDFTTVYRDLIKYALEVLTLEGATVPSLAEMISVDYSGFTDEIKDLIEKSKTNPVYIQKVDAAYKKFVEDKVNHMSSDLLHRVKDSGRMKLSQITEMMLPQMSVNYKGEYYIADNSLVNGPSHKDYVMHAVNNRAILQMKQEITPKGGYLNRQLIYAGEGVTMDRNATPSSNEGVWIPRNHAEGRTTVDGEKLGPSDSTDMVLVRSYAMSKDGRMTPDLISEKDGEYSQGSNIGLRITSAVAGSITQGGLSLKHTGTLRKLDEALCLKAHKDCTVERKDIDRIIIHTEGKTIGHYIPSDFLISCDGSANAGEVIGFKPNFVDPGAKSKKIIDLLGGLATDEIEFKKDPNFSMCVSPWGGKVHYDQQYIYIGNHEIARNPERVYYYFEGEEIKPYTIICDGTLSMKAARSYCDLDRDYYGCFRTYFMSLMPGLSEQTVEYVFSTINKIGESGHFEYTGIREKVRSDKSIMTNLGYEGASNIVKQILSNPEPIVENTNSQEDLFSQYYLTLINDNSEE